MIPIKRSAKFRWVQPIATVSIATVMGLLAAFSVVPTLVQAGTSTFTVSATDQRGLSTQREFVLTAISERVVIEVTGGDVVDSDGFRYHTFTHTGDPGTSTSATVTVSGAPVAAEVLLVAGGGGGGRNRAGGGGAGGLLLLTPDVEVGITDIEVGGGGQGGYPALPTWSGAEFSPGCNGVDSRFGATVSAGGGGGGGGAQGSATNRDCATGVTTSAKVDPAVAGGAGGSGGGGGYLNATGGSGLAGQGNAGATATSVGGGGGGAGMAGGQSGAVQGGGDGVSVAAGVELSPWGLATGTGEDLQGTVWYAGGGAGFGGDAEVRIGGKGGGRSSVSSVSSNPPYSLLDGIAHTGGGGAACANGADGCRGGNGGSGVVIMRYPVPQWGAAGTGTVNLGSVTRGDSISVNLTGSALVQPRTALVGVSLSQPEVIANTVTLSATTVGVHTFTLRALAIDNPAIHTHYTDRTFTLEVLPEPATDSTAPTVPVIASPEPTLLPAPTPDRPTPQRPLLDPPTLVGSQDAERLRTPPSMAAIVVDGQRSQAQVTRIDQAFVDRPPALRNPDEIRQIREQGEGLIGRYNSLLPDAESAAITLEETPTGASVRGLFNDVNALPILIPVENVTVVTTDSTALMVAAIDGSGEAVRPSANGLLELQDDAKVGAAARGFDPRLEGEIVLFSDPILVATFQTDAFGEFIGEFEIPFELAPGEHTLAFVTPRMIKTLGIYVGAVPDLSERPDLPELGLGELPGTGSDPWSLWVLAMAILGLGVLLVRRPLVCGAARPLAGRSE